MEWFFINKIEIISSLFCFWLSTREICEACKLWSLQILYHELLMSLTIKISGGGVGGFGKSFACWIVSWIIIKWNKRKILCFQAKNVGRISYSQRRVSLWCCKIWGSSPEQATCVWMQVKITKLPFFLLNINIAIVVIHLILNFL